MSEYGLLFASALVSTARNLVGIGHGGGTRRILIVKLDHLGDVINALPALRLLRARYPEARIDLVLARGPGELLNGSPLVDRVLLYDSPRFTRVGSASQPEATIERLRRSLAPSYDVIVELRGDWRTLGLPWRLGSRRRVDRGSVRLRDWLARRFGSLGRPLLHEVETNLAIVAPLLGRGEGAEPIPEERAESFGLHEEPRARASLEAKLDAAGVDRSRALVCIHPGAGWRPRAWRPERFAAIGDWLAARYGATVIYLGSEGERDIEAQVRGSSRGGAALWLFGELGLPEIACLLRGAQLLVGNDSGLVHLAAACGTPTVALFGAQDPRRFRPWSDRCRVLHRPVDCFPCDQTVCFRPELPCVNLIEQGEVLDAIRSLLGPEPIRQPTAMP